MTAPLTDQQLAVLVTRLTYRPTLQGPESNPWLTLHNTVDGQERERFVAAAFTDVPVLLAEVTRLRAELEQAREARLEWSRIGDHPELANWADSLVSADLTPHPAFAWCGTTTGYEVAAQVAITDRLTDTARDRLLTDTARDRLLAELRAAFTETVCRVLDRSPAAPACSCAARPVRQAGCDTDQGN